MEENVLVDVRGQNSEFRPDRLAEDHVKETGSVITKPTSAEKHFCKSIEVFPGRYKRCGD